MAFERMTGQRRLILEAVLRADDHPTAMQIYERVAAEMPNVSLTTVYRNLNRLTADGKIRRITIPNEPDRFDKTVYDHYHIACEVCGFFGDVTSVPFDISIPRRVAKESGYALRANEIIFRGVCPSCQAKIKKEKELMHYGTERI